MFWVLRTKTSQQEQQEQLYPLLDHAAARLVKTRFALQNPITPYSTKTLSRHFIIFRLIRVIISQSEIKYFLITHYTLYTTKQFGRRTQYLPTSYQIFYQQEKVGAALLFRIVYSLTHD